MSTPERSAVFTSVIGAVDSAIVVRFIGSPRFARETRLVIVVDVEFCVSTGCAAAPVASCSGRNFETDIVLPLSV
jgi:hypothetical protein